jgi:hypothetical protein
MLKWLKCCHKFCAQEFLVMADIEVVGSCLVVRARYEFTAPISESVGETAMFSFNPLNKNDFFGSSAGAKHARHGAPGFRQPAPNLAQSSTSTSQIQIQKTLEVAYKKLEVVVSSRVQPSSVSTGPGGVQEQSDTGVDFSPQSVSDRILGFVQDRLQTEKANGASDSEIQELYQQALTGIERGLREAKEIIQGNGLFGGEIKDNFYATVTKLADGLEALGQELFNRGTATTKTSTEFSQSEVAVDQRRSFEMEVMTQDGDKVTLVVNSGQSAYSNQYQLQGYGVEMQGYSAGFSSYDNLSFSVVGDLDEGEMAALADLFQQVNKVAETFYGGNVEQAFDQAMAVGMDAEELAAFAVDMKQSQTVAIRDTYAAVENMAGPVRNNPLSNMMDRLGAFADKASDAIQNSRADRLDGRELLKNLISRFHSDYGSEKGNDQAFQKFVNKLA